MKSSLRRKLMIVLLLATVLPISISILITYQRTTTAITEQAIKDNSKLLFQGKTNLVNYFDQINALYNSIYYDTYNIDSLFRLLRDGLSPLSDHFYEHSVISSKLRSMSLKTPDIFQIRLVFNKGNYSFLLANDILRDGVNVVSPDEDKIVWRPGGYIQSSHMSHAYGVDEKTKFPFYFPRMVVSFHRPIIDVPSDREIGRLSIDISLDYIRSISEMLYTADKEELWILNPNGDVVFSSNEAFIGQEGLQDDWVQHVIRDSAERGQFKQQSNSFKGIVVFEKMKTNYMDWTVVKRIPYNHLYSEARQITRINTLVLGIFLLITVLMMTYISFIITKPIKRLLHSIHAIKSGNMEVDIPIPSKDEIGILALRFRQLMEQINGLILREYRLEIANKTNQLKALQAQINPHFMNNALQSIGTLALKHKDRQVYSLISSLGKLMRYHMNTEESVVPLRKEIEHVKAYAELQKQRFSDNLDIQFIVDPATEQIEIPKMIIQPLMENVFKHGVISSEVPISIVVRCELTPGSFLSIHIEDNGRGVDADRLAALQAQLDRPEQMTGNPQEVHIGLANVLMRLRLFFNNQCTMIVRENAEAGGGFIVSLSIPMMEED